MKIVVCVKQVPDTTAEKRLTPNLSLDRGIAEPIINPFDEYALEEALRVREQAGGEVTALCMGPSSARETLRKALAMGVNRAILVSDPALERSDTLGTAHALSLALRKLELDLLIFGMQSTDAGTGQVPGATAEFLRIPLLSYASQLEVKDGRAWIRRSTDTGFQRLSARLPAAVSVVKGINEPRYPSLKGMMQAKRAEIPVWSCADIGVDPSKAGRLGAATRVISALPVPPRSAGPVLVDDGTAAIKIVEFLEQKQAL